jgi:hypothetical protein
MLFFVKIDGIGQRGTGVPKGSKRVRFPYRYTRIRVRTLWGWNLRFYNILQRRKQYLRLIPFYFEIVNETGTGHVIIIYTHTHILVADQNYFAFVNSELARLRYNDQGCDRAWYAITTMGARSIFPCTQPSTAHARRIVSVDRSVRS